MKKPFCGVWKLLNWNKEQYKWDNFFLKESRFDFCQTGFFQIGFHASFVTSSRMATTTFWISLCQWPAPEWDHSFGGMMLFV